MASPGASPRGQFASVEEYVEFVGGQRPIKKVRACLLVYLLFYFCRAAGTGWCWAGLVVV